MKPILIFLAVLLCTGSSVGQGIRLNAYGGYVFKERVDSRFSSTSFYDGTIQDGFRWGLGLEYNIPDRAAIEIQYLRQVTNAPTRYQDDFFGGDVQFENFDLELNWVMLNGTRYFPVSDVVEPFAGIGIGLGIFNVSNPTTGNNSSVTKFAWQLRGGTNLWLSSRLGLRVQAGMISAAQSIGGGLYFGTGGVGTGLSTYSTMYQFSFDGGVVLKMGG